MHNCVYHLKFTGYDKHGFAVMECQKCKKGFILISVEQNEQNMVKFVVHVRPFKWFFEKQWYSFHRWKCPVEYEGWKIKLIDIGALTFGYRRRIRNVEANKI